MTDRYHCHPSGASCGDVPCRGHRVTKTIRLVADVLAWSDGWDDAADSDQAEDYWASAGDVLSHLETVHG